MTELHNQQTQAGIVGEKVGIIVGKVGLNDIGKLVGVNVRLQVVTIARDFRVPPQGSPPNAALEAVTEQVALPTQLELTVLTDAPELHEPTLKDGHKPVGVP